MKLETVKIQFDGSDAGFITINKKDYDETKHKLLAQTKKLATKKVPSVMTVSKDTVKQKEPAPKKRVNLNSASLEELITLKGVGKALAVRIEQERPYKNIVDLENRNFGVKWSDILDQIRF